MKLLSPGRARTVLNAGTVTIRSSSGNTRSGRKMPSRIIGTDAEMTRIKKRPEPGVRGRGKQVPSALRVVQCAVVRRRRPRVQARARQRAVQRGNLRVAQGVSLMTEQELMQEPVAVVGPGFQIRSAMRFWRGLSAGTESNASIHTI